MAPARPNAPTAHHARLRRPKACLIARAACPGMHTPIHIADPRPTRNCCQGHSCPTCTCVGRSNCAHSRPVEAHALRRRSHHKHCRRRQPCAPPDPPCRDASHTAVRLPSSGLAARHSKPNHRAGSSHAKRAPRNLDRHTSGCWVIPHPPASHGPCVVRQGSAHAPTDLLPHRHHHPHALSSTERYLALNGTLRDPR